MALTTSTSSSIDTGEQTIDRAYRLPYAIMSPVVKFDSFTSYMLT
jgi:hypothetical protein